MAIEIIGASPEEPLNFNKIFMVNLTISQQTLSNISEAPKYSVSIVYRKYAIDSDGDVHYHSGKTEQIIINDYLPEALAKAAEGDMALISALKGIEAAIASIISTHYGLSLGVS